MSLVCQKCNYCDHFKVDPESESYTIGRYYGEDFRGRGRCTAENINVNGFSIHYCPYYKESIHNWYNIDKDEYWLNYIVMNLRHELEEDIFTKKSSSCKKYLAVSDPLGIIHYTLNKKTGELTTCRVYH